MLPQVRRILYATDLSKNSSYAFLFAVDLARRYDAKIVILHSVEPGHPISYAGARVQALIRASKKEEQERGFEKIKKELHDFCGKTEAEIGAPCVELVSKIVVPLGHPVEEILKAADEEGCDAIVLGTHGKGFLKQTFLGSVAGSVLERTRKPVFVIPLPSETSGTDSAKI